MQWGPSPAQRRGPRSEPEAWFPGQPCQTGPVATGEAADPLHASAPPHGVDETPRVEPRAGPRSVKKTFRDQKGQEKGVTGAGASVSQGNLVTPSLGVNTLQ